MKDEKLIDEYAELVAKFKAGDMSAFGELYERTHRMVYATCLGILQNEDDAFDVMQETYIKANETLDTLKDNRAFIAWLNKIASNKALTLVKKKHRHSSVSYDDAIAADESLQLDDGLESLPDSYIMDKTKREALHEIVKETLSDVQYQTVHMHYFSELSVKTISELMGCQEGTVKTRLKAARGKIKEGVKQYEKDNKDVLAAAPGVPAVPFLTRFFRAVSEDLTVPPIDISSLVGGSTTKAVAGMAAKETVKAGFLSSTAGKITLGALAVSLVATAAVTTKVIVDNNKGDIVETTEALIETEMPDVDLVAYTDTTEFVANVNVLNYNGHSYACYYGCATWEEASELCKTQGGYLAVIDSQEENDVVFAFARSQGYDNVYIGLSDSLSEGTWEWVTGDAVEYSNWNPGEPNAFTDSEDYAVFADDGTWNDGEFTPRIENGLVCFVCEWDYYVTGITNVESDDLAAQAVETEPAVDIDLTELVYETVVEVPVDWDPEIMNELHVPQVNLEGDEIAWTNQTIIDDIYREEINIVGYSAFWSTDSIFTLIVDYSFFGYDGFYTAYSIDVSSGHVLTNQEILAIAGISNEDFYDLARSASCTVVNDRYAVNGSYPFVDGNVNQEWINNAVGSPGEEDFYYSMLADLVSPDSLNVTMDMLLGPNGQLYIWRAIMPVADYHDAETFYSVPGGEVIDTEFVFSGEV